MIETKHITQMVQHIVRRNRGLSDPQIMHPMREWLIGIVVTGVVGIIGSVAAALLYHSYSELRGTEIAVVATSTPYKVKIVDAALAEYRQKRKSYDALLDKKAAPIVASSTEVTIVPSEVIPRATTTPVTVEFPEAASVATTTVIDTTGPTMAI